MANTLTGVGKPRTDRLLPAQLIAVTIRSVNLLECTALVTIDGVSQRAQRGPCPFQKGIVPTPSPGDKAWALEANTGQLVIMVWSAYDHEDGAYTDA